MDDSYSTPWLGETSEGERCGQTSQGPARCEKRAQGAADGPEEMSRYTMDRAHARPRADLAAAMRLRRDASSAGGELVASRHARGSASVDVQDLSGDEGRGLKIENRLDDIRHFTQAPLGHKLG